MTLHLGGTLRDLSVWSAPPHKRFHWPHFACAEPKCDFQCRAEWAARVHEAQTGHEVRAPEVGLP